MTGSSASQSWEFSLSVVFGEKYRFCGQNGLIFTGGSAASVSLVGQTSRQSGRFSPKQFEQCLFEEQTNDGLKYSRTA